MSDPGPTLRPVPNIDARSCAKALPALRRLRDQWLKRPSLHALRAYGRAESGAIVGCRDPNARSWCMVGWVNAFVPADERIPLMQALRVASHRLGYGTPEAASDCGLMARHRVVGHAIQFSEHMTGERRGL